jgi:hypothetical protein
MRLTILTLTGTARVAKNLRLFKIAFALVRLNHVAPHHRKRESQHHMSGLKNLA